MMWAANLIGFLYGFIVDVRVNNNDNARKHLYNTGEALSKLLTN